MGFVYYSITVNGFGYKYLSEGLILKSMLTIFFLLKRNTSTDDLGKNGQDHNEFNIMCETCIKYVVKFSTSFFLALFR